MISEPAGCDRRCLAHNDPAFMCHRLATLYRVADVRTLTKSCPVAAVDVVQVIAVLCQELGVGGVESQSVATGLEFRDSAVAFPVLVARVTVGVESVVIWALEVILSQYCKETQVCIVRVPGRFLDAVEVT